MTEQATRQEAAIAATGLSKWYGNVAGLLDVDLTVSTGVVGLLGPNGAGKTTFLRMVTGQLKPSTGSLTLFGKDPWSHPEVLSRIGYAPEHDGTWDELTGRAFVRFAAELAGMDRPSAAKAADAAIERVTMEKAADRPIKTYSKGMRQRIKLAQAIVADPDLVILDEPLTGCDPLVRADIIALIRDLGAHGKTLLVSSHILHEVEAMTDEVVLLYKGHVLATGDVASLRELIEDHPHKIEVRCNDPRVLAGALVSEDSVRALEILPGKLLVETERPDACYPAIAEAILAADLDLEGLLSPDEDLEAVFRYLTSRDVAGI